jgi:hypothetical protein
MDLVGNSTPTVDKLRLTRKPVDRYAAHLDYLRSHPGVRDVVVSGGDVANVPFKQLEAYLMGLLSVPTVRDIRLATKALMGLPQHWLQADVVEGLHRVASVAAREGVNLTVHTHINHVNSLTPLVAKAARTLLEVCAHLKGEKSLPLAPDDGIERASTHGTAMGVFGGGTTTPSVTIIFIASSTLMSMGTTSDCRTMRL